MESNVDWVVCGGSDGNACRLFWEYRWMLTRRICAEPAGAPVKIREAWRSDASNKWSELGVDVGAAGAFADAGDLQLSDSRDKVADDFAEIERAVLELVEKGERPVSLGGDHSVTYPILKAFARHYPELTIVHLMRIRICTTNSRAAGCRMPALSHALWRNDWRNGWCRWGFAPWWGISGSRRRRFGVEVVEMAALPAHERLKFHGPVYISFDMDVLDPAFAPGFHIANRAE